MKLTHLAAAVAAVVTLAGPALAHAETSFYGNVGFAAVSIDDINLTSFQVRGGAKLNPYIGAELEGSFGANGDSIGTVDFDLKHEVGAFVVGSYPVSDNLELFARAGFADSKVRVQAPGVTVNVKDNGAAYGAGVQYFMGDTGVRLDYTKHDYNTGGDVWSLSLVAKF